MSEGKAGGDEEVYKVGNRVILHGLKGAAHLNGRHGHIGNAPSGKPTVGPPTINGRYSVNLDLLDPSTPKVAVKPTNLTREPEITANNAAKRAPAKDACIAEEYGRPICVILDSIRFITAKYLMSEDDIETMQDIERMRFGADQRGLQRLNHFLAMAWSHWLDPGSFQAADSVFEMCKQWGQVQLLEGLKQSPDPTGERAAVGTFISHAFDDTTSVKSWHVRVHGDFWIVGSDNEGAFLIPIENSDVVYQTVGQTSNLARLTEGNFGEEIPAFTVTMIPVNGRLLYDGVVTPARATMGIPLLASPAKAAKLRAKVKEAKASGRVVQRLRQLEVEGGSLEGLPTHGEIDRTEKEEQPPATSEETAWVKKLLKQANVIDRGSPQGTWVFRRFGYTEQDNPKHIGVIIAGEQVLGKFMCSQGLKPISMDILSSTANMCAQLGGRPGCLMLDDIACCERVKFLLSDIVFVDYYHPPTPEETAAAMSGPQI